MNGHPAVGEVPDMKADRMREIASDIFVGKVARIYTSVEKTSADFEMTYSIAELKVEKVEKGDFKGKLAYVRFNHRRFIGKGPPIVGANGQREVPKVGETARAYIVPGEDCGFDALPPNGFTAVDDTPANKN